ncbi:MAG TPA: glycosyltransferase family 2 protein [Terriglobales bacterium]|nr:glycosyltransferase family 2 protein [Terriglobales bacterium]
MPRLTIAILTFNRADLVGRAIESALAQTLPDIEILVSDNGSTDETPSVLARYSDPRLRSFRHDTTMPVARHGQFLIDQARGEFLLGLSDDDYLEPQFAAEILAALDRNPDAAFAYTGCAVHYEDIQVPALVGPPLESGADFLLNHYSGRRELSWCACVTRVRDLRELGPQPEDRIVGDMFYWTKIAFRGPVVCVPQILSHYILLRPQARNDNISHGTSPLLWAREARWMVDEVMEASRKAGAGSEYLSNLESEARRHVARSAANQFVWTRIRGASLPDALRWSIDCLPYLSFTWPVVTRIGAALLVPPAMLRSTLLKSASRLAASRCESQCNT